MSCHFPYIDNFISLPNISIFVFLNTGTKTNMNANVVNNSNIQSRMPPYLITRTMLKVISNPKTIE